MKNLINLCVLILTVMVMTSCPGPESPAPDNTEITTNDLANYYLVAEHKTGGNRLIVMSFAMHGDVMKSSAHLQGALRVNEIKVENSTFKFDYNSNGESMYTFTLRKDASGNLQLQSYDFTYNGVTNQLSQAVLVKKSDAPAIINKTFWVDALGFKIEMEGSQHVLQWIDGKRYASYTLDNYGFKTNADELMGVVVPAWTINGKNLPGMLVESGDKVTLGVLK
ncbi:MAG TPA: hypothetical protein VGN64_06220 [Dyadobacter sp.]|jgi:hypothetical protein|nr:hypothetical protein [Dyadobacter sp.]